MEQTPAMELSFNLSGSDPAAKLMLIHDPGREGQGPFGRSAVTQKVECVGNEVNSAMRHNVCQQGSSSANIDGLKGE